METTFTTIDEYIAGYDGERRQRLEELREIIRTAAPKEAKETINYRMPTFRYNGNLIHFAMFKHHIGVYPGVEAVDKFAQELKDYKTSKGAVQLPLDKSIPQKLITDMVLYNVEMLQDKKNPSWETKYPQWEACEEFMAQLILKTTSPLKKEIKWGANVYTFSGKNVIGWGGFKDFFSLWFYNGVFLTDPLEVLITASEGKTKSLRQWRFTDVKQMDEQQILNYIEESVQTIRDGKEIKPEKASPKKAEGLLKEALDSDVQFADAFQKLTPGKQKDYIEHIAEAKQEKTKLARIDKIKPMILEGKGLHDKYKR